MFKSQNLERVRQSPGPSTLISLDLYTLRVEVQTIRLPSRLLIHGIMKRLTQVSDEDLEISKYARFPPKPVIIDDVIISTDLINRTRDMLKVFIDRASFTDTNSSSFPMARRSLRVLPMNEDACAAPSPSPESRGAMIDKDDLETVNQRTKALALHDSLNCGDESPSH